MHAETRYFFIFENVLGTTNFWNCRTFFPSSAKYYFLQKFRYIQWNLLNFELVSMLYFLWKAAGFCFLINLKFKKVLTSLLTFLALSKNKNSSRLIVGPPLSFLSNVILLLVFGRCFLFIYTICISIICVSQEELNLIASIEQMCNF